MRRLTAIALGALGLLLLPAVALPASARADVRLEVRTDRTALSLDDTLTLQVTVQAEGMGEPDITMPPFEGFEIVGQQVQRPMQFSFSFGARTTVRSSTVYTFKLQPVRTGNLVIKPVRAALDDTVKTSQPVRITVSAGSNVPPANPAAPVDPNADPSQQPEPAPDQPPGSMQDNTEFDPVAFVRTVVDKPEPYEGEQVTVTIYLYVRDRLQSAPALKTEPTTDGLWLHSLIDPQRPPEPSRQVVGDSVFAVYTLRRFAAFPLHAGELTIGPLAVSIDTSSVFDIFGPRQRKTLERSGLPSKLNVKPLPEAGRPPGEIAVGRFQVSSKLDRAQVATGDAVTLVATVSGEGNIRTVQLTLPPIPGLEVLAPEVKDIVESPNDQVGGTREYRWLLVAREPGRINVPPLSLQTFDPRSGQYKTLSSAPATIEVVGNALPTPAAATTAAAGDGADDAQPTPDGGSEHTWAPIRTRSELERGYVRLVERSFFPFALLAPALLFLGVVGTGLVRRRLGARSETETGRALRRAETQLRSAENAAHAADGTRYFAAASAALHDALEARLGEAVTGLTRRQLGALLAERGMDDVLRVELLRTLEQCELARFGNGGEPARALEAQLAELRSLYRRVNGFEPRAGV
jgi:hypothetical protein